MRQRPKRRMYPRGRPQRRHLFTLRVEYLGSRWALIMSAFLATRQPPSCPRFPLRGPVPHGEAQQLEELQGLLIGLGRGHHRDVQTPDPIDVVIPDLREDQLLVDAQGVVAPPVEAVGRQAREVPNPGQRDMDQLVDKVVHALAPQGHLAPDGHPRTDPKVGDGLLRPGDGGLLARNHGQVTDGAFQRLGVVGRLAHAHVEHHFVQAGHLHDARVPKAFHHRRDHLLLVQLPQPGHGLTPPRSRPLVNGLAAVLADPDHLLPRPVLPIPDRLVAAGADQHHVGRLDGGRALHHPALGVGPAGAGVPLDETHDFHHHPHLAGINLQNLAALAPVGALPNLNQVAFPHVDFGPCLGRHALHLPGPVATDPQSTSGARETIRMKFRSRSSRATGPKIRVPRGICWLSMITAAFSSKRRVEPSGRRMACLVRTTTAFTTSPFLTSPPGVASFTEATITSPTPAYHRREPPRTRMHRSFFAPELSATFNTVSCCTMPPYLPGPRLGLTAPAPGSQPRATASPCSAGGSP